MSPRRIAVIVSAVATAVALVIVLVVLLIGRGSTGSVAAAYPRSYVIVYTVIQNGAHHWEVLSVQRPFTASDLTYTTATSPHDGDQPSGGSMSTANGLYAVDTAAVRLVSGRQPGVPAGDQYAGASIAEMTRRGLARDLGTTTTVAGRTCRIYRFAAPPSGAIAALAGGGDHDDLCFDADGLELSEAWVYRGAVVLQRTAVEVHASPLPVVQSSAPQAPSTDGAAAAGPNAATITADAHPSTFIADPPPPQGFVAAGPAVDFRFPDPQSPSQAAAASVVWAFTDGAHVITVEAGSESGGGLPWSDGDTVTEPVGLRGLGPATTAVRSDGFELRIDLGQGEWVRVRGTVPLDQLIAYGHRLTRA